jgi:hypothetical protein
MTPRKKVPYFTKLDPALREVMRQYKEATGIPEAQQVDRALRAWLGERGVIEVVRTDGRVGYVVADDPAPPAVAKAAQRSSSKRSDRPRVAARRRP